jgi:hypothetical protein
MIDPDCFAPRQRSMPRALQQPHKPPHLHAWLASRASAQRRLKSCGASVLLCRRPRLETERAIAALKLGVAASRALSAVYAIKVVIVAPGTPLAREQNLKNSACGAVAVGLDYRSFPPGMSCEGMIKIVAREEASFATSAWPHAPAPRQQAALAQMAHAAHHRGVSLEGGRPWRSCAA